MPVAFVFCFFFVAFFLCRVSMADVAHGWTPSKNNSNNLVGAKGVSDPATCLPPARLAIVAGLPRCQSNQPTTPILISRPVVLKVVAWWFYRWSVHPGFRGRLWWPPEPRRNTLLIRRRCHLSEEMVGISLHGGHVLPFFAYTSKPKACNFRFSPFWPLGVFGLEPPPCAVVKLVHRTGLVHGRCQSTNLKSRPIGGAKKRVNADFNRSRLSEAIDLQPYCGWPVVVHAMVDLQS